MCKAKKKLSPCFRREKKHVVRLISESLRHKNGFSITTWRRLELTNVRCILVENIVSLEFLKTESHWKIYCKTFNACTVVESHRKDLIQHCEWSKLRLHFECTKVHKNVKKSPIGKFLKLAVKKCYQTGVTYYRTKISWKSQNSKTQMRHFGWLSNTVLTHRKKDALML